MISFIRFQNIRKIPLIRIIYLILISSSSLLYSQSAWIKQNSNVNYSLNDVFFVNDQTGWIAGDACLVLKTTNGGSNWTFQSLPDNSNLHSVFFINDNTGWVAGGKRLLDQYNIGVIFKTTNGGATWSNSSFSGVGIIRDILFIDGNIGIKGEDDSQNFASGGGISQTVNSGINWTNIIYSDHVFNSITFKDSQTGWAAGYQWDDTESDSNIIKRTTNGGETWSEIYKESFSVSFHVFRSLYFINSYGWVAGKESKILHTTNNGDNWTEQSFPSNKRLKSIFFTNINTGWAAGAGNGDTTNIIKTSNGGLTWFNLRNTYENILNSIFFVDPNIGWAVGNNYPSTSEGIILKTTNGGLTRVGNESIHEVSSYILNQNYPNPFNPLTVISYSLPSRSNVKIVIYDIQGKELETLVNENKSSGHYETTFNAAELSSGIYYYSLYANGNKIETKKMSILK